jgi:hypothetical protein
VVCNQVGHNSSVDDVAHSVHQAGDTDFLGMEVSERSAGMNASAAELGMLLMDSPPGSAGHSFACVQARARGGVAGTARNQSCLLVPRYRIPLGVQR